MTSFGAGRLAHPFPGVTFGTTIPEAAPPFGVFEGWGEPRIGCSPVTDNRTRRPYSGAVPRNLHRRYQTGHLHFITSSCYRRRAYLTPKRRDLFLQIFEQVRRRYRFIVVGYVVMPEHFHLLISEPERGTQSTIMQVLKQRFARKVLRQRRTEQPTLWEFEDDMHVWQRRFYDFVVRSEKKKIEKLRYIHRNPVKRGLVSSPELWRWSSFRFYRFGEPGPVLIDRTARAEMKVRPVSQKA